MEFKIKFKRAFGPFFAALILITACSAPKKYNYYFDHQVFKPKQSEQIEPPALVYASADTSVAEALIIEEVKSPVVLINKQEVKQQIRKIIKSVKRIDPPRDELKRLDNFALAGFITSLIWPLFILAIIFSTIGLKSRRRGFAIAGLIIGIATAFIFLLIGIALLNPK